MRKSHEISIFATISHGCKEKNILFNHDAWLQRILFPLQPLLTISKRPISWDFPIIFMKRSQPLKICVYLWIWQKKGKFHFAFFKIDSNNPQFNWDYLLLLSTSYLKASLKVPVSQWLKDFKGLKGIPKLKIFFWQKTTKSILRVKAFTKKKLNMGFLLSSILKIRSSGV